MIHVDRGPEIPALATARHAALAKATLAWSAGRPIDFDGYRDAARPLYESQHFKCAWCERVAGWENQPVEHYRPKGGALDGDPLTRKDVQHDEAHYWWLAWSWDNLLFACGRCNGAATKGNWFPLAPGSQRLPAPSRQPHLTIPAQSTTLVGEPALLLDPGREDPMAAIVWTPFDTKVPTWCDLLWLPRHTSPRGQVTIAILKLDRDHASHVSADIRTHVEPKARRLATALTGRDLAAFNTAFDELEMLFAPTQPFLAARYDAWQWFLGQPPLAGLQGMSPRTIPQPGSRPTVAPQATVPPDPPEAARLSPMLVLRLRAKDFANVDDGVLSLSAEGIADAATLARLLGKSLPYVRQAVQRRDKVLALCPKGATISIRDAAQACALDPGAAKVILDRMVERGLLQRLGRGRATRYRRP